MKRDRSITRCTMLASTMLLACGCVVMASAIGCAQRDANGWAQHAPSISPDERSGSLVQAPGDDRQHQAQ